MKSKYIAVIPFLFAFGILLISGCSVTTQKSTSSQENMPEIIIGSDDFPPFNYSDENGSQVDLTAYGRSDEKGIIITFYHTSAEYARNYNLTIQSLLSGYDTYSSGMIVVTDGKNVVASNDENLIGLSSEGINIIQQVKQKPANKLVRVSDRKCRYIGRMTKGRD